MADNTTLNPGTGGDVYGSDDISSVKYQRIKLIHGIDGTNAGDVAASNPLPVAGYQRPRIVAASQFTRPGNTTAYSINDAVSNSATAGSVVAMAVSLADINDAPLLIYGGRFETSDTGVKGKGFKIFLFNSDPTASTGIVGGDNAAYSTKKAAPLGMLVGTFNTEFTDGSFAPLSCESGPAIIATPVSGGVTIYGLAMTLEAFTPLNASVWTLTLFALQGRA